jgi:REP element-mobilizing transposase RayT
VHDDEGRVMTYDPKRHHRRSIRLKGYDYAQAGAYFITLCTQNRDRLFGDVVNGDMRLNEAGRMIESVWAEMPACYPGVETDEFVVMPDHVHGIVVLVGATPRGRPYPADSPYPADPPNPADHPNPPDPPNSGQARGPAPTAPTLSVGDVVHRFKTMTTRRYATAVKQYPWTAFAGRLWQRNYYEHIIRNEESLNRIRRYIAENPARCAIDPESPHAG